MESQSQVGQMQKKSAPANASMQACIDACLTCFQSCEQMIIYCLSLGGKHAEAEHIKNLQACAEICQTSAKFMMLQSRFHRETCGVCADVCTACAESCEKMGGAEMQSCADICRKCADSCQAMSQMQ